jgi:orotate phosphoribosyltransferase
MSLFEEGVFHLHSGSPSQYRINCEVLTDFDLEAVAARLAEKLEAFSSVEGIPRGGLRLAEAMKTHYATGPGLHLIVDDVWTSGASMYEAREKAKYVTHGGPVMGAVIFVRGPVLLPHWVVAFGTIDI